LSAKRLISSEPDRKSGGYFQGFSNHLKCDSLFVMAGHSRLKDDVASARLCPGHLRLWREDVDARHKAGHDELYRANQTSGPSQCGGRS
jgi:hypothetical protein